MRRIRLTYRLLAVCLSALVVMLIVACSDRSANKHIVELNAKAYECHYRNLDSTKIYAEEVLRKAQPNSAEYAHAQNDLAFYYIAKMRYAEAEKVLNEVTTDNRVEQMISHVQLMRLCQRKSKNKDFYHQRHFALTYMNKINADYNDLSPTERGRFVYAQSEYWIVLSTYLYYIGQPQGASEAVLNIEEDEKLMSDMPQLLAFYYNIGSGGLLTGKPFDDIQRTEFNYLIRCYMLARQCHYIYWEANSMQAISEKLQDDRTRDFLFRNFQPELNFLNIDYMPDSLLAGNLADRALELFKAYGDVYQIAGGWRTLSEAYRKVGDYNSALTCLHNAIGNDTTINAAPDLVASIREQLSIVYSALNNKKASDYNRNIYLDIQEYTRQDRMLEARAEQLASSLRKQDIMIASVVVAICLLIAAMVFFIYKTKKNAKNFPINRLLQPLEDWQKSRSEYYALTEEQYEEMREKLAILRSQYEQYMEKNIEQRAKVSMASSVAPLINRMLHCIKALVSRNVAVEERKEGYEYISQLASSIEQTNECLTDWIKLRKGEIVLRIESFCLQELFDTLRSSDIEYKLNGITLHVSPTNAVVKADKVLTLFMLNTIAENARRYTSSGGRIAVYADETADYVEISVSDTGKGMNEEQLSALFKNRYIKDSNDTKMQGGHGFGLLNCKGIIEKYKKMSSFFAVCSIGAESEEGKGSRIFFRLPKGIKKVVLLMVLLLNFATAFSAVFAATSPTSAANLGREGVALKNSPLLKQANLLVDSIYYNNVKGNYARAIGLADSCIAVLNEMFSQHRLIKKGGAGMCLISSVPDTAFELQLFRDSVAMDYDLILALRNEIAVSALVMHDMALYDYNNQVLTKLFRERSADRSIGTYVQTMQRAERNRNIAIGILVLLFLAAFPTYYFLYYRHKRFYSLCIDRIGKINALLQSTDLPSSTKVERIKAIWQNGANLPKHIAILGRNTAIISDIVERICRLLAEDIGKTADMEQELVLIEEDTKRITANRDRLYVINNILDNCLSTLKHETMFYPSRLKQILAGRNPKSDEKELLATLDELASYYETMYTTLLSQTVQVAQAMSTFDPHVAMRYLLDILRRNGAELAKMEETDTENGYAKLTIPLRTESTKLQVRSSQYLILCQIMRDIGEYYRARGCGIEAKAGAEAISTIVIYIKKEIWRNLK